MKEQEYDSITIYDWRNVARGKLAEGLDTDYFYCEIADELYQELPILFRMGGYCDDDAKTLCIRLSLYLEDVVSDLGIFKAFRSICREQTGKDLPFYKSAKLNEGTYSEDKVNLEDIQFLLWDYLTISYEQMELISPYDANIQKWAKKIYNLLTEKSKTAPKNDVMERLLYCELEGFDDYETTCFCMMWLLESCYLTSRYYFPEIIETWVQRCRQLLLGNPNLPSKYTDMDFHGYALQEMLFCNTTRYFAMPFNKFYARMLRLNGIEDLADDVEKMVGYPRQLLKVVEVKNDTVYAKNWDGELFTFDFEDILEPGKEDLAYEWRYLSVNVIRFCGKDYFFGMQFQSLEPVVKEFGLNQNWNERVRARKKEVIKKDELYDRALEVSHGSMVKFFPSKDNLYRQIGKPSFKPMRECCESDPFYKLDNFNVDTSSIDHPLFNQGPQGPQTSNKKHTLIDIPSSDINLDDLDLTEEEKNKIWDKLGGDDFEDDDDWDDDDDFNYWDDDEEDDEEEDKKDPFGPRGASDVLQNLMNMFGMDANELKDTLERLSNVFPQDFMGVLGEGMSTLEQRERKAKCHGPQVLVVHDNRDLTRYDLCIKMINLPNNPYYDPNFTESVPFEYALMSSFDYDFVNYLKDNGALMPSRKVQYSDPIKVRKFILDNFEFMSKFFYVGNFRGYYGGCKDFEGDDRY